jgi:hypothetical protein
MGARVRVEKEFVRIEPVPCLWLVWPVDPEAVERSRSNASDMSMKDFVSILRQFESIDFAPIWSVE